MRRLTVSRDRMKEVVALKLNYLRTPSAKRGQQFEIFEILSDEGAAGLADHVPQPEDIVSSCRPGDVIHSGVVHLIGRVTYVCQQVSFLTGSVEQTVHVRTCTPALFGRLHQGCDLECNPQVPPGPGSREQN